jgi:16S rRNA C967 or C1407 C5-methylase (RsmB/RsmF family)
MPTASIDFSACSLNSENNIENVWAGRHGALFKMEPYDHGWWCNEVHGVTKPDEQKEMQVYYTVCDPAGYSGM